MTASQSPTPLSDEQIVAYLDGVLPEAEAAVITAARASDPDLDARISAMDVDLASVHGAMDSLLSCAPELPIDEPAARSLGTSSSTSPGWGWRAAAAAVIFAAGLGAGVVMDFGPDASDWRQAVADYQVLYTSETVTATPLDPVRRAAGLAHVSSRLGLDLDEARIAVDGLTFQRAQILDFQGQALGQLVYLDQTGTPIAFCLMRAGEPDRAPEATTLAGMAATTWTRKGVGFIVIGPADPGVVQTAAETLRSRIAG